jgi:hypothetical protein
MVLQYPRSTAVRIYYTDLEEEYLDALEATPEKNAAELEVIRRNAEDFDKHRKNVMWWANEAQLAENKWLYYNRKGSELEREIALVQLDREFLKCKLTEKKEQAALEKERLMYDPDHNHIFELELLQKKFMKPIYVTMIDPKIVNTLSKSQAEKLNTITSKRRGKKKKAQEESDSVGKSDKPALKYKMEKYMSAEEVIRLDLKTESEDERDRCNANSNEAWERGITYDMFRRPSKTDIRYYTINDFEPVFKPKDDFTEDFCKILYIPKPKNKKNVKAREDYFDKLKAHLNTKKEYYTPIEGVWKVDLNTLDMFLKNAFIAEYGNQALKEQAERDYAEIFKY